jgi:ABC-2 type transport system ATP-binding protein
LADNLKRDIDAIVSTRVHENSLIVDMRSTERLVPRLVASAESSNVEIIDLAVAEPSLETVFINLTGKELREV